MRTNIHLPAWLLLLLIGSLFAGDNERTVIATRTSAPPKIDGYLTERVWQTAVSVNGFLQRDPYEGQPATEPTEIRILYDDEALYFGCLMYDSEPDKIVARLTRRDNEIESDMISIRLDSYHDHKTAYEFTILASGVKVDILQFNDAEDEDDSWDAVWEVKTQIVPGDTSRHSFRGWIAEVKIPFRILRYTPAPDGRNEWGINFIRRLSRKQERTYWALVYKNQNGFISHFGHLILDGHLPIPRRFELLPYAFGKVKSISKELAEPAARGSKLSGNAGFDLKYGLNSNLTLDLTINPDFGQVEADPAVLNLTTYETFYPEKRPFFIEGRQILTFTTFGSEFGPGLFYSRRIGRPVTGSSEPTTILGAAKITGKTRGLGVGILQAVTDKKSYEPRASYSVVRLKQDVLENSTIGMIATSVARESLWPAFTGGVDWNLRFRKSMYGIDGFWAGSHTTQNGNRRITGAAGKLRFGKDGGEHWLYSMSADFTSRHYNINDIGFFRRPNDYGSNLEWRYKEDQPGKILRRWSIGADKHFRWNFDGARLFNDFGLNINWEWLNYWEMSLQGKYAPSADDDRESRGLGLYRKPRSFHAEFQIETDSRKPVIGEFGQYYLHDAKGQRQWNTSLSAEIRPTSWAVVNLELGYDRTRNRESWVTNLTGSVVSTNPISIFGFRDTDEYDVTLRSNLTFTRDLTLQIYGQAFVAKGHFDRFERLVTPTTLVPYHYTGDPDFNEKSFNLNVVWRWEYHPGSVIYLVWTQARKGESEDFFTPVQRDFRDAFSLPAENVVLLKISYWRSP
ncbi:MAG: carbohydrate binding family 9 domain-containing protein [candidate division KSB1 bacterium]|nr:carbohydrate binding family 9 domain-containing protein [candidate division KSB1 bacterium]MDZ7302228.1 carbohydrate binding family 9 domain-containing protein [candidate division KSB1 bacterium]MDZ7311334.1 carbohydrate binding family 9 domain-containing protein [candidate division KSB1 bacterium]